MDETTTSQAKKQYDGYVAFYSELDSQVITMYCGTLFVGRCPAKVLKEHMFEFFSKINLCPSNLLSIGMDGPSVNLKFHKEVSEKLNKSYDGKTLVDVGTCQLHIANNGFLKLLAVLKSLIDLDQFASDLHGFLRHSAARRVEYSESESLTEVTARFMLRHVRTRSFFKNNVEFV